MDKPTRYHPLIVSLHWLVALLTFMNLGIGLIVFRSGLPSPVGLHMLLGILVLIMIIIRFAARFLTRRPEAATTGNKSLDLMGVLVHYGLYFFLALITVIGLVMSLRTGDFQFTFLSGIGLGNIDFSAIPARILGLSLRSIHRYSAYALLGLATLHVLAAMYHQFTLKDNLLGRMWFKQPRP